MSEPKVREWKTIAQATEITSLSRSMLYSLMTGGQLQYTVVGRCRRIPLDALQRLMESGLVGGGAEVAQ